MFNDKAKYRRLCREAYGSNRALLEYVDISVQRARGIASIEGADVEVVVDATYAHRLSSITTISNSARARLINDPALIRMLRGAESHEISPAEISAVAAYDLTGRAFYFGEKRIVVCKTVLQACYSRKYPLETVEARCLADVEVLGTTGLSGVERLRTLCRDKIIPQTYLPRWLQIIRNPPTLTAEGRRRAEELSADVRMVVPEDLEEARKFFYG